VKNSKSKAVTLKSRGDLSREKHAIDRGIPISSSWYDIVKFDDDLSRKKHASFRGLSSQVSWQDIVSYDQAHAA